MFTRFDSASNWYLFSYASISNLQIVYDFFLGGGEKSLIKRVTSESDREKKNLIICMGSRGLHSCPFRKAFISIQKSTILRVFLFFRLN